MSRERYKGTFRVVGDQMEYVPFAYPVPEEINPHPPIAAAADVHAGVGQDVPVVAPAADVLGEVVQTPACPTTTFVVAAVVVAIAGVAAAGSCNVQ